MIRTYGKNDLTQKLLLNMSAGEQIIVRCDSHTAYNIAATQARIINQRKPDELKMKGIAEIRAEIIKGGNDILIKAISE